MVGFAKLDVLRTVIRRLDFGFELSDFFVGGGGEFDKRLTMFKNG